MVFDARAFAYTRTKDASRACRCTGDGRARQGGHASRGEACPPDAARSCVEQLRRSPVCGARRASSRSARVRPIARCAVSAVRDASGAGRHPRLAAQPGGTSAPCVRADAGHRSRRSRSARARPRTRRQNVRRPNAEQADAHLSTDYLASMATAMAMGLLAQPAITHLDGEALATVDARRRSRGPRGQAASRNELMAKVHRGDRTRSQTPSGTSSSVITSTASTFTVAAKKSA